MKYKITDWYFRRFLQKVSLPNVEKLDFAEKIYFKKFEIYFLLWRRFDILREQYTAYTANFISLSKVFFYIQIFFRNIALDRIWYLEDSIN